MSSEIVWKRDLSKVCKRSIRCHLIFLAGFFVFVFLVLNLHDFLATTHRVEADVLVVEGWAWKSSAMREASAEFHRGGYAILVSVGLSEEVGGEVTKGNSASLAAQRLQGFGVDKKAIIVLALPPIQRHRTYASALAVKEWLASSRPHAIGVNVFTLGAHARKSVLLFKRAFGQEIPVGVIAGTDEGYHPDRWWLSTRGIYTVLRKTIGYIYAELWPLPNDLVSLSG